MPGPAGTSNPPAPRRPVSGATVAIAATGALVVGLGIGWFLPSPGATSDLSTAEGRHSAACELVASSFPGEVDQDDLSVVGTSSWDAFAVSGLLQAAAAEDEEFADSGERGQEVLTAYQRFDLEGLNSALEGVRESC
ncbi:hypothetical protein [Litorihabitans aurantiacus]|uniref:Uncharacterized protein n=1 Tax=Litorihabitans aurantiacus TaxID=1930061 RepID=A0AA37XFM1_9MICO|nr:hypothetical protein [Litorihabitans aurantiacus]GMA32402.1 hypothetical protein GCM10025875_23940 [Litorihabitans aurantiacus]